MSKKIISPFRGKPLTEQRKGLDRKEQFWVYTHTLTPMRAQLADFTAGLITLAGTAYGLHELHLNAPVHEALYLAVIAGGLLVHPVVRLVSRWYFRTYKTFRISEELFSVRSYFIWKHYDRKLPHKISLLVHDKAQIEAQRHELEIRKAGARGQIISKRKYFGESFHLIYEYVGQRFDLLSIFGRIEAVAIASRLKACDEVMTQRAKMGDGIAINPGEQWDDQPGDI